LINNYYIIISYSSIIIINLQLIQSTQKRNKAQKMGNDGGSIPHRAEVVKNKKKEERKD